MLMMSTAIKSTFHTVCIIWSIPSTNNKMIPSNWYLVKKKIVSSNYSWYKYFMIIWCQVQCNQDIRELLGPDNKSYIRV